MIVEIPDGWEAQDVTCPRCGLAVTAAYPYGLPAIECGWCGYFMPTEPEERERLARVLPPSGNA